jgi:hypothetical protein
MPPDITGIPFTREAHHDLAAHPPPTPPPAGPEKLIARLLKRATSPSVDERPALRTDDAYNRLGPRRRILAAYPALFKL